MCSCRVGKNKIKEIEESPRNIGAWFPSSTSEMDREWKKPREHTDGDSAAKEIFIL